MAERVLLTGASGLVGKLLSQRLLQKGYSLVVLGRSGEESFRSRFDLPCEYYQWKAPADSRPPSEALQVDHVVNLMGESLASGRWNEARKKEFVRSRVDATHNLVEALNAENPNLKSFVSASAIGIYGDRKDEELFEESALGDDFLAKLCVDWEVEARRSSARSVQLRIGLVLSLDGGVLAEMAPIFRKGLGGPLGSGKHWMSWIHIDDLVEQFVFALENTEIEGAVNAVAPVPERNKEFTRELARVLKMPALFPAPPIALKFAVGEFSSALLASQKVNPQKFLKNGFKFKFEKLSDCLSHTYSWLTRPGERLFTARQWVPKKRDEVFDFFSSEKNLEKITPPFLNFRVLQKSTDEIQEGTLIDYKLSLHGLPLKWRTEITNWKPNESFQDRQLSGPYAKWEHTHEFHDLADGVLLTDEVVYRLPMTMLGSNVAGAWVRGDVQKIFAYRRKIISEMFQGPSAPNSGSQST